MILDLSGDSDDEIDANQVAPKLDEIEIGVINLSNDAVDVSPTIAWRDDIDHYAEINGSLLLLDYRICGAGGCLQRTQLDY